MTPFFFGDSKRQLFGVYDPAPGRSSRGAVVCHPWAREYLLAHPTIRLLSQRLANSGWHSLRFDYLGTGDSAGGAADATQGQWLADIATAIDELKEIAQVKEVALIGMRVGATLAALAAAARTDVARLVLWDPVADGRTYLAELGVSDGNGRHGTEVDVQGGVLTDRLRAELGAITPTVFGAGLPRTLVVSTESSGPIDQLVAHLRSTGVDCSLEHIAAVQAWREEWNGQGKGLPVEPVGRIVSWLG